MKEKLSALIDGELDELDERRVLKALADDPELRRVWERYHLIRAAVTRQLSALAPAGLAERVGERLDADEARAERSPPLRFWPLAGGFAAAAGLAAVAIVGVQLLQAPSAPTVAPLAVAPPGPTQVVATAVTSGAAASSSASAQVAPAENPTDPLNLYLVGHNEFMPTGSMGSMLPYVRVVTHGSDGDK